MEKIKNFLNYAFSLSDKIHISVKTLLIVIIVLIITAIVLRLIRRLVSRKLPKEDSIKFISIFNYLRWIIYTIIFLVALQNSGVNLTALLTASAALLIGVGLAMQTLFQDIISGIFILADQTVHVGDIIQLDGKVGRVEEIKLRTTRAVTFDNKVLIIPNHLYLTSSLYNWTQNGSETRENIKVGVAYGSDTELVKNILIEVALSHPKVFHHPAPMVLFTDFADSALMFKLIFTLNDSFVSSIPKSDMRFEIDKKFRENGIQIPFPQRDIHIINK
ncbi:MAG: mechanosensitive ion channel protein MscS [Lutibacter sp.]|nr:MAG: mechanosensitive ion channel protein MscS [Lutibacter sp.]